MKNSRKIIEQVIVFFMIMVGIFIIKSTRIYAISTLEQTSNIDETEEEKQHNDENTIQTYFDITSSEFGAIADDAEDDYEAINRALKKAKEIEETITVFVPAGEYIISNQLFIYSNTKLVLDDDAIIRSTSSVDMSGMIIGVHEDENDNHGEYTQIENIEICGGTWNRSSESDLVTSVFILRHGKNINIHDLTVKNCTEHMINISADKDVTIKNVIFQDHIPYTGNSSEFWGEHEIGDVRRYAFVEALHTDFAGEGEKGALPLDNTTCDNIIVDNCIFDGVLSGIGNHHESEYKTKNVTIMNCTFNNTKYGQMVNAWSFDSINVTNNTMIGSDKGIISIGSTGIISSNSFNVTDNLCDYGVIHLENSEIETKENRIQNASMSSIMVLGGKAKISNNIIETSSLDGIKAKNTTELYITNNTMSDIKRYGVFIYSCDGTNIITENTINASTELNSGNSGVFIENSGTNNVVDNNIISGIFDNDICMQESNGTISDNVLNLCNANAIYLTDSNATVSSNQITNTTENAICLNKSNAIVSLNRITNTTGNAIYALYGEVTINDNIIESSGIDGIRADKISDANVSNNKINNAERYGIFVSNSNKGITISSNEVKGNKGSVGVLIEKCKKDNIIDKNIIKCGTLAGIFALNCEGMISENDVTECSGDALQTLGDINNLVSFIIKENNLQTASESNYDIRLNSYSTECKLIDNVLGEREVKIASGVTYFITGFTGIKKDINGIERYYKNGLKDNSSGIIEWNGNLYYIKDGLLDKSINSLILHNGIWYYFKNGMVDYDYTGLIEYNGTDYYIQKGILKWGVNGLTYIGGIWYYIKDSSLQKSYTGLVEYNKSWFYVQNGVLKWGVRTLVQYYGTWYYVNNSTLDWNYIGLCEYYGTDYYIQKGVLKWNVNGLTYIEGTWYYLKNSSLQKKYTGLVEYNKSWFYIQKGVLKWGVRTLVQYYGTWYYVNNSTLDWNYTGLVEYNKSWFYVQKGVLKWGVRTLVQYYGTWYYVNNSTLDWNYTGLCEYYGTDYFIQKGVLKWGYNGTITINGKKYNIENSMVSNKKI